MALTRRSELASLAAFSGAEVLSRVDGEIAAFVGQLIALVGEIWWAGHGAFRDACENAGFTVAFELGGIENVGHEAPMRRAAQFDFLGDMGFGRDPPAPLDFRQRGTASSMLVAGSPVSKTGLIYSPHRL